METNTLTERLALNTYLTAGTYQGRLCGYSLEVYLTSSQIMELEVGPGQGIRGTMAAEISIADDGKVSWILI